MSLLLKERYNITMTKNDSLIAEAAKVVEETTSSVSSAVDKTEQTLEKTVAPVRKHFIKRFPIVFLMLVTLGFTATITGMEQLLLKVDLLQSHPSIVLIIGLGLLILTGTLYKKLG